MVVYLGDNRNTPKNAWNSKLFDALGNFILGFFFFPSLVELSVSEGSGF